MLIGSALTQAQLAGPPGGVPVRGAPSASYHRKPPAADAAPDSGVFRGRLLDGRTGSPVDKAQIRLWYDDAGGTPYTLTTNARGIAVMPEPVGMPVRVLVSSADHIECRKLPPSEPLPGYNLTAIAAKGDAAENRCGTIGAKPAPGELVFYVRPLKWYENLNRR